jgi:hypothetical protein
MTSSLRPIVALVAILALAALIAGCAGAGAAPSGVATLGSPSPEPGTSDAPASSQDPEEAVLAYAECMRENGVDMPDPQVGANGEISMSIGGNGLDRAAMQAAQEACGDLMEGAFDGPRELTPEQKDALIAFAGCMRDHGIDMPDPQFDGGRVVMRGTAQEGGPRIDPQSGEFAEAQEACSELLGDMGRGPAGGPGLNIGPGSGGGDTEDGQ